MFASRCDILYLFKYIETAEMTNCTQNGMTKSQPGTSVGYISPIYENGKVIQGVILNVSRYYDQLPNEYGGKGIFKKLDGDGRIFATTKEASQWAKEHGYTREFFMSYDPARKQRNRDTFWKYIAPKKGILPKQ